MAIANAIAILTIYFTLEYNLLASVQYYCIEIEFTDIVVSLRSFSA
jgi:hypothetical protein